MKLTQLTSLLLLAPLTLQTLPQLQLPSLIQLQCLVLNTYHEARGEPVEGKIAVAQVVLNRVDHANYPKTICRVVYQAKQFSWTIQQHTTKIVWSDWQKSLDASVWAYNLPRINATHYHSLAVHPNWNLVPVKTIKNHVFYTSRGQ